MSICKLLYAISDKIKRTVLRQTPFSAQQRKASGSALIKYEPVTSRVHSNYYLGLKMAAISNSHLSYSEKRVDAAYRNAAMIFDCSDCPISTNNIYDRGFHRAQCISTNCSNVPVILWKIAKSRISRINNFRVNWSDLNSPTLSERKRLFVYF